MKKKIVVVIMACLFLAVIAGCEEQAAMNELLAENVTEIPDMTEDGTQDITQSPEELTTTPEPSPTPSLQEEPVITESPSQEPYEDRMAAELLKDYFYGKNETGYTIIGIMNTEMQDIVIPDIVTRIETLSLNNNSYVTSLTVPDSVTYIGGIYFYDCNKLTTVDISTSVDFCQNIYFIDCTALKSVKLPEGLTEIPERMFAGCTSLEKVVFPSTLEKIYGQNDQFAEFSYVVSSAFMDFSSLKHIELPYGIPRIDVYAFHNTGLTEVVLPDSVTEVKSGAFWGAKDLSRVVFSKNLQRIEENAFRETAISECIIPEGVTFIGYQAFMFCDNLEYVSIPGTVKTIGDHAFDHCPNLREVYIEDGVESLGSMIFNVNPGLEKITIPASVTSIGDFVYLADGVTIYTPAGSYAEKYFTENVMHTWNYTIVNY